MDLEDTYWSSKYSSSTEIFWGTSQNKTEEFFPPDLYIHKFVKPQRGPLKSHEYNFKMPFLVCQCFHSLFRRHHLFSSSGIGAYNLHPVIFRQQWRNPISYEGICSWFSWFCWLVHSKSKTKHSRFFDTFWVKIDYFSIRLSWISDNQPTMGSVNECVPFI